MKRSPLPSRRHEMTKEKSTAEASPSLRELLKRRDKSLEYFECHPDSYGAMAQWEMDDDNLLEAFDRLEPSRKSTSV